MTATGSGCSQGTVIRSPHSGLGSSFRASGLRLGAKGAQEPLVESLAKGTHSLWTPGSALDLTWIIS